MAGVSVQSLLEPEAGLALTVVAGRAGLLRKIGGARIQKPGLALTGFTQHVHAERMQVLGLTEIAYLRSLDHDAQERGAQSLGALRPCVVVVTRGLEIPPALPSALEQHGVALLSTPLMSSVFINRVQKLLELRLAPTTSVHGVLIDVLGVGVLLLGKSGIGKSEAALDLVLRGHRLVADDVVEIRKRLPDIIVGASSDLIKHHVEIRGLGILNIKDLFGISSVRDTKRVDLVIELSEWNEGEEYDRLGVEERRYAILDVALPMLRVPIRPGRNIASIIEVAARNQLLKQQGKHSARDFQERLSRAMDEARPQQLVIFPADEVE
ncbi:MAG: HPr(Ser) kinase/phosphatase [Deltaproteobacteria bacterium]|jgi:HPr kinase/phosphorylase|nr:HPr(Ser) kinase/phosphatase [Deltaproteobacteria bacterium]